MNALEKQWAALKAGDMTQFRDGYGKVRACYVGSRSGKNLRINYRLDCGEIVRGAFISIYDLVSDAEVVTGRADA